MSKEALADYERARGEQQSRNEARGIRRGINQAQQNAAASAFRWPFELLQNALDAGPRDVCDQVSIVIRRDAHLITFSHDGMPFTSKDLAALLSGGSNKDFDSPQTTGRFGTGFLSTHSLSDRLKIQGLLRVESAYERFQLDIDRHGDEDHILANTKACNASIDVAVTAKNIDGVPSALFQYPLEDGAIADGGLQAFHDALPYLYATRPSLGRVEIVNAGHKEAWTASHTVCESFEDGYVSHRQVTIESDEHSRDISVYWFEGKPGRGSAITIVEQDGSHSKVTLPSPTGRRIFRDYPLQASAFLPMAFVLNGKFDPDTERSGFSPTDNNRRIIQEALSAALLGVKFAFSKAWKDAHLLAAVRKPALAFHADQSDLNWWIEELAAYAQRLSQLPIIETREGSLPAAQPPDGSYADFVVPRLTTTTAEDETSHYRMWRLLDGTSRLYPPSLQLSSQWTEIAYGWHHLGVQVNLIALKDLVGYVKEKGDSVADLSLKEDGITWLTLFLDVLGECREKSSADVEDYLAGLLPNQNRKLHSPAELRLDVQISEELKTICATVGMDVRDTLLLCEPQELASAQGLSYVSPLLEKVVSARVDEDDVIADLIEKLDRALPQDADSTKSTDAVKVATAKLIDFLWKTRGHDAADTASAIPLVTSGKRSVRWSSERMLMAPIASWPEAARPFAEVYPEDRVLSQLYQDCQVDGIDCVKPLIAWRMVFAEPLSVLRLAELKEKRLTALAPQQDVQSVIVPDIELSNVALLAPEVLNRCANDPDRAKALLGLILCYVVRCDSGWREERLVRGRRAGKELEVRLRPAVWIADLKVRAWVPRAGEDDSIEQAQANATTLNELLDPKWLTDDGDAILFLSTCFGFDSLDLHLLRMDDAEAKKRVRDELARIVQAAGNDPEIYQEIVTAIDERAKRARDVERARRLGLAVEEAVKATLTSLGLTLKQIDRGFDYEVKAKTDDFLQDFGIQYEVGPYLLEIKATTTGKARMTPLQAETASTTSDKYVLCVVDLRETNDEELDLPWTPARVEPLARFVANIGYKVKDTWELVDEATSSNPVRIRNESALRYEVPPEIWEGGLDVRSWAETLRAQLLLEASEDLEAPA